MSDIKRILVPIDFSETTRGVLEAAVLQAKAHGADIILLHVEAPEPDFVGYKGGPPSVRKSVSKEIHQDFHTLESVESRLKKQGLRVKAMMLQGSTVEKIIAEARRAKADLIIIGTHSRSAIYRLFRGCISEAILRRSPCPILLVK